MASPAPSRPPLREPDRRRCRRPPTTHQPQVAHPPGEPPDSSFLSPSRWFAPIRRHRAIIQLPDLGSSIRPIALRPATPGREGLSDGLLLYDSPEYRKILPGRLDNSTGAAFIVEGANSPAP